MMGVFLRSQRGREFMVQVPISNIQAGRRSAGRSAELVHRKSLANSLINRDYLPYTADEVDSCASSPLQEIDNTRGRYWRNRATTGVRRDLIVIRAF